MKTVNFKEIANWMAWNKETSIYRKIQRFFSDFTFDKTELIKIIIELSWIEWPYFLSMDRTNWKYWEQNINILTIGIVYWKTVIPIYWEMLDKRWNSNQEERKEIMDKVIEVLWWKENISWLLADREFIWEDWFNYLISQDIPFWIRIKENLKVISDWKEVSILSLFRWLWKTAKFLPESVSMKWNKVYLSWINNRWENLIVASNRKTNSAIAYYKKRWSIEVFFSYLKTTWFNFEDTHLKDLDKISKLVWILWIAVVWCHKVWEGFEKITPTKIKKHWRKAISTFKRGFRIISAFFLGNKRKDISFWCIFKFLSCT